MPRGARRAVLPPLPPEAIADEATLSARAAGLRYVSDSQPGIRRRRAGKGFVYLGTDGKVIRDAETLARLRSLAVPPAWTDVWICPSPHGHIQAVGRDARGRKQYRYHARWSATRNETKFHRSIAFAEALPNIRRRVEHDLSLPGLPREKVLAVVVSLLQETLIRIGNPEYASQNDAYGLTTLQDKHVNVTGSRIEFRFRGKGGKEHRIGITDPRLARLVKRCREIPGSELFQYLDEERGSVSVDSGDVNAYLREVTGGDFSAKDFRTWGASVRAALALCDLGPGETQKETKSRIQEAIQRAAQQLGNTATICRKYYVHPTVLEAYEKGTLAPALKGIRESSLRRNGGLDRAERALLALLRKAVKVKKAA